MADITSNLELLATFEGNLNDSSGAGRNGSGFGSPTYGIGLVGSQSVDLEDGSTQYVDFGNNVGIGSVSALSIAAWITPETLAKVGRGIAIKDGGLSSWVGMACRNSQIDVYVANGSTTYATSNGSWLIVGQPVHVCLVYDGTFTNANTTTQNNGRLKLYVNGIARAITHTGTVPATAPALASTPFRVGRSATFGADGYFDGLIDDARVYSRALAADDVKALVALRTGFIPYTDSNLHFSPNNFVDTGDWKQTVNTNSELDVAFSGTSLKLMGETGSQSNPLLSNSNPAIEYSVDGGAWTRVSLDRTQYETTIASGLSSGGAHSARIKFASGTLFNQDRWNTPSFAWKIRGVILDSGASLSVPTIRTNKLLVYGDSHSEGGEALAVGSTDERDDGSARQTAAQIIADYFNMECSSVAFGSQGYSTSATPANVPNCKDSWDKFYSGQSRLSGGLFIDQPHVILLLHGHNTTVQADVQTTLSALRAAAPTAKIVACCGPNQQSASAISAAVTAVADANTFFVNHGESLFSTAAYKQGTAPHLTVAGHVRWAELLIPLLGPYMPSSGNSYTSPGMGIGIGMGIGR